MVKADDVLLFVQVVDTGSFSKVAEQLQLTNSVVSKRIGRLEESINVQLLYRSTRKLSLTEAGQLLYHKAKVAKAAMQDATDAVTGYSSEVKGTIKITMPVVSSNQLLSRSVAEFCLLYPDINVELYVDNRVVNLIDEGFDLAIRTAYLADSNLIARRLIDSQWTVCATPEYLRVNGTPQTPDDLIQHQCLVYKYESTGNDSWLFSEGGVSRHVQVHGQFNTNNLNALCQAALANLGIVYLPRLLVYEHLQAKSLVPLLGDYAGKTLGIYAVYPKSRQPDQKLKLLIEHLREAFQKQKNYFNELDAKH